jgi:hypothetical protein
MKKYTISRQVSEDELGGEITVTQSSTNPEDRRVKIPVDVIRALKLAGVKPLKGMCRVINGEIVITILAYRSPT